MGGFEFRGLGALLVRFGVVAGLAIATTALVVVSTAAASIPAGSETSGNGNLYVLAGSVRPGGPDFNGPVLAPANDLGITIDDGTAPVALPFRFVLQGVVYAPGHSVSVSANGAIFLDAVPSASDHFTNQDLAATNTGAVIAPYWDDLNPAECSQGILEDTFGAEPNRVWVVEWRNVCDVAADDQSPHDGFTFQARLFESSNTIEYHYADVLGEFGIGDSSNNGVSATVGISAGAGLGFLQYSINDSVNTAPIDSDGFAIRFSVCASDTVVLTGNQLDAAINCYNQQTPLGDHLITLGASFDHASGSPTITQADPGVSLVIDGDGFEVTGPGAESLDGFVDLFSVSGAGPVTLKNATVSGADEAALFVTSGDVVVVDLTINNSGTGMYTQDGSVSVAATTFTNNIEGASTDGGFLTVANSIFDNNEFGVNTRSGVMIVRDSFITNNTASGVIAGGGFSLISNSTVALNARGLDAAGAAFVFVANSTVANNTQVGVAKGGTALLQLASSVVDGNGVDCSPSIIDAGKNFQSAGGASCGASFAVLSPGSLGPVADNSCAVPTPSGCVQTAPLQTTSNAIGGGVCAGVVTGLTAAGGPVVGDLATDQRGAGFVRTLGRNCDAGAFEAALLTDFVDVPANSAFYADAVTWAKSNGITTGTTTTMFTPNGIVTRAQMATFLWRFAGEPAPSAANPFTDVPDGVFFTDAVAWLAETGVTTGTSATTFSPNDPLTRGQMATFLWRFAGEPALTDGHPFTDVPAGVFFTVPVTWLAETGITTGTSATTFSPADPLTRGQAVTFLHRFAQQPPFG